MNDTLSDRLAVGACRRWTLVWRWYAYRALRVYGRSRAAAFRVARDAKVPPR